MRRSKADTEATRERLVEAASRLIRARGPSLMSVADVMAELGMTVGGFYKHFESKDALVAEAIDRASRNTTERIDAARVRTLDALVGAYLSCEHRDHPERGCPIAALATEIGHESEAMRTVFEQALVRLIDSIDGAVGPHALDRKQLLHVVASLVGALALARAVPDRALSREILAAVSERLGRAY